MIGTSDPTCIVRIPVEQVKCRIGGEERQVLRLATTGFCFAEYGDGSVFPISNPLEQWLLDVTINSGKTPGAGDSGQQIYFIFEAAGERGDPGENDKQVSLINNTWGG